MGGFAILRGQWRLMLWRSIRALYPVIATAIYLYFRSTVEDVKDIQTVMYAILGGVLLLLSGAFYLYERRNMNQPWVIIVQMLIIVEMFIVFSLGIVVGESPIIDKASILRFVVDSRYAMLLLVSMLVVEIALRIPYRFKIVKGE